ncbi:MAG: S1C family serine protease [Rubrivivax sp.]|jgi:serine protease Do
MNVACRLLRQTALLVALGGGALAAQALTPAEIYAKVSPSVWRVQTYDAAGLLLGQGSGVVIAAQRLLTNCHVLARAQQVSVRSDMREQALPATLHQWDPQRDLCLLAVPALQAPPVPLSSLAATAIGQPAYAIGHPRNLDLTMSSGLVSSLRRNDAGQIFLIQTSAAISGGSSGGGLFNERGELLGLTTIGSVSSSTQNLNFAVPADWVADLPRRHAAQREQALKAAQAAQAASAAAPR